MSPSKYKLRRNLVEYWDRLADEGWPEAVKRREFKKVMCRVFASDDFKPKLFGSNIFLSERYKNFELVEQRNV